MLFECVFSVHSDHLKGNVNTLIFLVSFYLHKTPLEYSVIFSFLQCPSTHVV